MVTNEGLLRCNCCFLKTLKLLSLEKYVTYKAVVNCMFLNI
ncbi:unnamed protein product [Nezara viridula]|nr:unnamed protein product [Nezara viridula]